MALWHSAPIQFYFESNLRKKRIPEGWDSTGKGRGQGLQIFNYYFFRFMQLKLLPFEKQKQIYFFFRAYQAYTQYQVYAVVYYIFLAKVLVFLIIIAFSSLFEKQNILKNYSRPTGRIRNIKYTPWSHGFLAKKMSNKL